MDPIATFTAALTARGLTLSPERFDRICQGILAADNPTGFAHKCLCNLEIDRKRANAVRARKVERMAAKGVGDFLKRIGELIELDYQLAAIRAAVIAYNRSVVTDIDKRRYRVLLDKLSGVSVEQTMRQEGISRDLVYQDRRRAYLDLKTKFLPPRARKGIKGLKRP